MWQHHGHTLHKLAQRVVLHGKQQPMELGQLWHRQQLLEVPPAMIWMAASAAQVFKLVYAIHIKLTLLKELQIVAHQLHHLLQHLRAGVSPQHHHHHSHPNFNLKDI